MKRFTLVVIILFSFISSTVNAEPDYSKEKIITNPIVINKYLKNCINLNKGPKKYSKRYPEQYQKIKKSLTQFICYPSKEMYPGVEKIKVENEIAEFKTQENDPKTKKSKKFHSKGKHLKEKLKNINCELKYIEKLKKQAFMKGQVLSISFADEIKKPELIYHSNKNHFAGQSILLLPRHKTGSYCDPLTKVHLFAQLDYSKSLIESLNKYEDQMDKENGKWKGEFVKKMLPNLTSAFHGGLEIIQLRGCGTFEENIKNKNMKIAETLLGRHRLEYYQKPKETEEQKNKKSCEKYKEYLSGFDLETQLDELVNNGLSSDADRIRDGIENLKEKGIEVLVDGILIHGEKLSQRDFERKMQLTKSELEELEQLKKENNYNKKQSRDFDSLHISLKQIDKLVDLTIEYGLGEEDAHLVSNGIHYSGELLHYQNEKHRKDQGLRSAPDGYYYEFNKKTCKYELIESPKAEELDIGEEIDSIDNESESADEVEAEDGDDFEDEGNAEEDDEVIDEEEEVDDSDDSENSDDDTEEIDEQEEVDGSDENENTDNDSGYDDSEVDGDFDDSENSDNDSDVYFEEEYGQNY